MGGMLNTRELLDIAGVLRAARTVRAYADGTGSEPHGHRLSVQRPSRPTSSWRKRSPAASLGKDEIADAASGSWPPSAAKCAPPPPGAGYAAEIISSPGYSKALQEAIITQRSER
jgi:DNA mismatch repair protein MutS2